MEVESISPGKRDSLLFAVNAAAGTITPTQSHAKTVEVSSSRISVSAHPANTS